MAVAGNFCIEYIDGHMVKPTSGLAWLIIDPPDKHVTAKSVFEELSNKDQQDLRNRFDYWLDGNIHKKYFHGWNEDEYKKCFVFKLKDVRLFGFLCHPRDNELRFVLCVLASHSIKDGWAADASEKNRMNDLRKDERVLKALKNIKTKCLKEKNNAAELDRRTY